MTPLKQLLLIAALGAASGQAQPREITGESVAEIFDAAYVTHLIFGAGRGEGRNTRSAVEGIASEVERPEHRERRVGVDAGAGLEEEGGDRRVAEDHRIHKRRAAGR